MLFLDSPLWVAAGASFVAGMLGYIIARFWIRPIGRYNVIKRRLDRALKAYLAWSGPRSDTDVQAPSEAREALRAARRHGMELVACYSNDIPYWYRLLLESRQELPAEASSRLTNLSKIRDRRQVEDRIADARRRLKLE